MSDNFTRITCIPPRKLTAAETKEVLAIRPSDITATLLKDYFAAMLSEGDTVLMKSIHREDPDATEKIADINRRTKARFQPNDTLTLPKGTMYLTEDTETTIGRYVYNLLCIPREDPCNYMKQYGYINVPLTKDNEEKVEDNFSAMMLAMEKPDQRKALRQYGDYLKRSEWICGNMCFYISPSENNGFILPDPEVIALRDRLFAEHQKEIDAGNAAVANDIENQVLALAKKKAEEENDPFYDYYKSKFFKFDDLHKSTSIMNGTFKDSVTGKVRVVKSNFVDGIDPAEYDTMSQESIVGGTSRGVSTQIYGFETKKFNAALQSAIIDNTDSDCGTTKTISVFIDPKIAQLFIYRFIVEGGKLIELTPANISKYTGKTVSMRSPMYCLGVGPDHNICTHCAGTVFKRIGIDDAGLSASNITGSMLNMSLKAFHSQGVAVSNIDIGDYIEEK